MKTTTNYQLKMPEPSDLMSVTPLNSNAQTIDAALKGLADEVSKRALATTVTGLAESVSGKAMMAFGSYTGNNTRSQSIATPGFKPQVVLMRRVETQLVGAEVTDLDDGTASSSVLTSQLSVEHGWCLWMGESTMNAQYSIWGNSSEWGNEKVRRAVNATITFRAEKGSFTWNMTARPSHFTSVAEDNGPLTMNNSNKYIYQWVAFGAAAE